MHREKKPEPKSKPTMLHIKSPQPFLHVRRYRAHQAQGRGDSHKTKLKQWGKPHYKKRATKQDKDKEQKQTTADSKYSCEKENIFHPSGVLIFNFLKHTLSRAPSSPSTPLPLVKFSCLMLPTRYGRLPMRWRNLLQRRRRIMRIDARVRVILRRWRWWKRCLMRWRMMTIRCPYR